MAFFRSEAKSEASSKDRGTEACLSILLITRGIGQGWAMKNKIAILEMFYQGSLVCDQARL
jgi:hypothetical protein